MLCSNFKKTVTFSVGIFLLHLSVFTLTTWGSWFGEDEKFYCEIYHAKEPQKKLNEIMQQDCVMDPLSQHANMRVLAQVAQGFDVSTAKQMAYVASDCNSSARKVVEISQNLCPQEERTKAEIQQIQSSVEEMSVSSLGAFKQVTSLYTRAAKIFETKALAIDSMLAKSKFADAVNLHDKAIRDLDAIARTAASEQAKLSKMPLAKAAQTQQLLRKKFDALSGITREAHSAMNVHRSLLRASNEYLKKFRAEMVDAEGSRSKYYALANQSCMQAQKMAGASLNNFCLAVQKDSAVNMNDKRKDAAVARESTVSGASSQKSSGSSGVSSASSPEIVSKKEELKRNYTVESALRCQADQSQCTTSTPEEPSILGFLKDKDSWKEMGGRLKNVGTNTGAAAGYIADQVMDKDFLQKVGNGTVSIAKGIADAEISVAKTLVDPGLYHSVGNAIADAPGAWLDSSRRSEMLGDAGDGFTKATKAVLLDPVVDGVYGNAKKLADAPLSGADAAKAVAGLTSSAAVVAGNIAGVGVVADVAVSKLGLRAVTEVDVAAVADSSAAVKTINPVETTRSANIAASNEIKVSNPSISTSKAVVSPIENKNVSSVATRASETESGNIVTRSADAKVAIAEAPVSTTAVVNKAPVVERAPVARELVSDVRPAPPTSSVTDVKGAYTELKTAEKKFYSPRSEMSKIPVETPAPKLEPKAPKMDYAQSPEGIAENLNQHVLSFNSPYKTSYTGALPDKSLARKFGSYEERKDASSLSDVEIARRAELTDEARVTEVKKNVLDGKSLNANQEKAIIQAHNQPCASFTCTEVELHQKINTLRYGGFTPTEAKNIVRSTYAGQTEAAEQVATKISPQAFDNSLDFTKPVVSLERAPASISGSSSNTDLDFSHLSASVSENKITPEVLKQSNWWREIEKHTNIPEANRAITNDTKILQVEAKKIDFTKLNQSSKVKIDSLINESSASLRGNEVTEIYEGNHMIERSSQELRVARKEATDYARDYVKKRISVGKNPFTEDFVKNLYGKMVALKDDSYDIQFKTYRTHSVDTAADINGVSLGRFEYMPESQVKPAMDQFFSELDQKIKLKNDPIDTAIWIERNLTSIHPFSDANGRVAREFASSYLETQDLPRPILSAGQEHSFAVLPATVKNGETTILFPANEKGYGEIRKIYEDGIRRHIQELKPQ